LRDARTIGHELRRILGRQAREQRSFAFAGATPIRLPVDDPHRARCRIVQHEIDHAVHPSIGAQRSKDAQLRKPRPAGRPQFAPRRARAQPRPLFRGARAETLLRRARNARSPCADTAASPSPRAETPSSRATTSRSRADPPRSAPAAVRPRPTRVAPRVPASARSPVGAATPVAAKLGTDFLRVRKISANSRWSPSVCFRGAAAGHPVSGIAVPTFSSCRAPQFRKTPLAHLRKIRVPRQDEHPPRACERHVEQPHEFRASARVRVPRVSSRADSRCRKTLAPRPPHRARAAGPARSNFPIARHNPSGITTATRALSPNAT